ncbi:hypothetical protein [Caballeronia sp. TF1N1]|uniref:hypothetical protein n=1 Tax=Caballeronia sp. TF1N1 TaxID=2878153 RepID=UPI001FD23A57|nr:hypothetical protein [Caballeronia sp. TF1N1]
MLRLVLTIIAVLCIVVGLLMTLGVIGCTGWTDAALVLMGFNAGVMAWALGNERYNLSIATRY